jgi:hypothetical protein
MSRVTHLSEFVDGLDIYADYAPCYEVPYWLLTPEQVAYLAGEPTRTLIGIERQTTRGSGDIITYRTETSEISVRYSPITHEHGWYESDQHGGSEILGSEIVRYVIGALGLEPLPQIEIEEADNLCSVATDDHRCRGSFDRPCPDECDSCADRGNSACL